MRKKIIKIDIYNQGVLVFVGRQKELRKYLKRRDRTDCLVGEFDSILHERTHNGKVTFDACTLVLSAGIVLFLENTIDRSTLVHECVHIARIILENIGAYPSDNDEPYAHLVEYLYREAEELCFASD